VETEGFALTLGDADELGLTDGLDVSDGAAVVAGDGAAVGSVDGCDAAGIGAGALPEAGAVSFEPNVVPRSDLRWLIAGPTSETIHRSSGPIGAYVSALGHHAQPRNASATAVTAASTARESGRPDSACHHRSQRRATFQIM
jgi:hypothetical protein